MAKLSLFVNIVPVGVHAISKLSGNLEVYFTAEDDRFLLFGGTEPELLDFGEPIYVSGNAVKTRRWI